MLRTTLVVFALTLCASTALAKDVCVTTTAFGPITYVLRGMKEPKAGKLAPVLGVAAVNFPKVTPALIAGTVYGQSDGKLRVDLLVEGLLPQGFAVDHVFTSAAVDRKFFTGADQAAFSNGTTQSGTWSPVDCKTLTVP